MKLFLVNEATELKQPFKQLLGSFQHCTIRNEASLQIPVTGDVPYIATIVSAETDSDEEVNIEEEIEGGLYFSGFSDESQYHKVDTDLLHELHKEHGCILIGGVKNYDFDLVALDKVKYFYLKKEDGVTKLYDSSDVMYPANLIIDALAMSIKYAKADIYALYLNPKYLRVYTTTTNDFNSLDTEIQLLHSEFGDSSFINSPEFLLNPIAYDAELSEVKVVNQTIVSNSFTLELLRETTKNSEHLKGIITKDMIVVEASSGIEYSVEDDCSVSIKLKEGYYSGCIKVGLALYDFSDMQVLDESYKAFLDVFSKEEQPVFEYNIIRETL